MEMKKDLAQGISADVKMGLDMVVKMEIDVDLKAQLQKLADQVQNPALKQILVEAINVLPLVVQALDSAPKA